MDLVDQDLSKPAFSRENEGLSIDLSQSKVMFSGVKPGKQNTKLPAIISLEANTIRAPLCVPHAKAALQKTVEYNLPDKQIDGSWVTPKITIFRREDAKLPLPEHLQVLDALIALLAFNFNQDGEVWFSFRDIHKLLGSQPTNNEKIKEAIARYHHNSIFFTCCWRDQSGRMTSMVEHIIEKTDLFDEDKKDKNPGRSREKKDLHYVKLCPSIVDSIGQNYIRLFPKSAFTEIKGGTYTLYKIFYGMTDKEPVRRTVEQIANFLHWGNRHDRLKKWVEKQLSELESKDYILWWKLKGDCFEVQCNPAKNMRDDAQDWKISPIVVTTRIDQRKKETLQKSKMKGTEPHKADLVAPVKEKKPKIKAKKSLEAELTSRRIIEELAKLSPAERDAFFAIAEAKSKTRTDKQFADGYRSLQ